MSAGLASLAVSQVTRVSDNTQLREPIGRRVGVVDRGNVLEWWFNLDQGKVCTSILSAFKPVGCSRDPLSLAELDVRIISIRLTMVADVRFDLDQFALVVTPVKNTMACSDKEIGRDQPAGCDCPASRIDCVLEAKKELDDRCRGFQQFQIQCPGPSTGSRRTLCERLQRYLPPGPKSSFATSFLLSIEPITLSSCNPDLLYGKGMMSCGISDSLDVVSRLHTETTVSPAAWFALDLATRPDSPRSYLAVVLREFMMLCRILLGGFLGGKTISGSENMGIACTKLGILKNVSVSALLYECFLC